MGGARARCSAGLTAAVREAAAAQAAAAQRAPLSHVYPPRPPRAPPRYTAAGYQAVLRQCGARGLEAGHPVRPVRDPGHHPVGHLRQHPPQGARCAVQTSCRCSQPASLRFDLNFVAKTPCFPLLRACRHTSLCCTSHPPAMHHLLCTFLAPSSHLPACLHPHATGGLADRQDARARPHRVRHPRRHGPGARFARCACCPGMLRLLPGAPAGPRRCRVGGLWRTCSAGLPLCELRCSSFPTRGPLPPLWYRRTPATSSCASSAPAPPAC